MRYKNTVLRYLMYVFLISAGFFLVGCHKEPDALDSKGQAVYLKPYAGKWIIVNYWAAWCKPCLQELPELNNLQRAQKNKLVVIGVHFDGALTPETHQFIDPLKLEFPIWTSFPAKMFNVQEISYVPTTLIIQPNGKLYKIVYGQQTAEDILKVINSK